MPLKILLHSNSIDEAINEVKEAGGYVPLQLSEHLFVALLPDEFKIEELKLSSPEIPDNLNKDAKIIIGAWKKTYKKISEINTTDDIDKKFDLSFLGELEKSDSVSLETDTSYTMKGKISLGIVVVSGPYSKNFTENVEFTPDECEDAISETYSALYFLSKSCLQAKINFFVSTFIVPILTPQSNIDCSIDTEACRKVYRNPVLKYLGYPETENGAPDLLNDLKAIGKANSSYAIFFSKYNSKQSAVTKPEQSCSFINFNKVVYSQEWQGIPLSSIIAHESCHIFGAADEYGDCNCNNWGHDSVPNKNCVNCGFSITTCIMQSGHPYVNRFELCNWTRGQIGWGYWQLPLKSKNIPLYDSPSITYKQGTYYIAFRSTDNKLKISMSFDGINWGQPNQIGTSLTSSSPSLCVFKNKLYVAIKGTDNKVYIGSSYDGINWSAVNQLGGSATSASPSICSFNDGKGEKLFIALKALDSSDKLYVGSTSDGIKWDGPWPINNGKTATSAAPALAAFQDRLYLGFKGYKSNDMYITSSPDGTSWTMNYAKINNKRGKTGPLLTTLGDFIYITFVLDDSNSTVCYGALGNGDLWNESGLTVLAGLNSNSVPSITGQSGKMIMAVNSNNNITSDFFKKGII